MEQKMKQVVGIVILLGVCCSVLGCDDEKIPSETVAVSTALSDGPKEVSMEAGNEDIALTEAEWKKRLTDKQYDVLRKKGTERAFTGDYDKHYESGVYKCAGCGEMLFTSESKYNSGCGWPAFSAPADQKAVDESRDSTLGMVRTEITCSKCGGHLGHVFEDGPAPTGLRYCINSAALDFEKNDEE